MSIKKKKRKRINTQQLKLANAERKNKFFKSIRKLCLFVGCEDVYQLIPKDNLEKIYRRRTLPFKVIAAGKNVIPKKTLSNIRASLKGLLEEVTIEITDDDLEIIMLEFHTICISFLHYLHELKGNEYRNAEKVKLMESKFRPFEIIFEEGHKTLNRCMDMACSESNELDSRIYWPKHEYEVADENPKGIENLVTVYSHTPEKIYDCKENVYRPAFRVCWGFSGSGVSNYYIKHEKLGIARSDGAADLKIYIQAHALLRMKERLDCLTPYWRQLHLLLAVVTAKAHRSTDYTFLIEYKLNEITVGYLVTDLNDGNLIIRTFLFITQNGTPEGDKLSEMCGLGKLDKSFLEMDRLSTFLSTDMCDHPGLKELFQAAGCQYLLDVYDNQKIKRMCNGQTKRSNELEIVKYLGLDSEQKNMNDKCERNKLISVKA